MRPIYPEEIMAKKLVRSFSIVIILSILLAQFGLHPAAAAGEFTVNSTADMLDADPGDGLCETDITGDCTLRAAVQEANALEGADTITIPAGEYKLTMEGAGEDDALSGDLDITRQVTITGAGPECYLSLDHGYEECDPGNANRRFPAYAHDRCAQLGSGLAICDAEQCGEHFQYRSASKYGFQYSHV